MFFTGDVRPPSIDYEADSLEEKNKIFRLLTLIVNHNRSTGGAAPAQDVEVSKELIKEGRVEKRGHSMAIFNWARWHPLHRHNTHLRNSRWLRVRAGELMYYKEDDLDNALNIIPLGHGLATVSKKGTDSLIVATSKKTYHFRVPAPEG